MSFFAVLLLPEETNSSLHSSRHSSCLSWSNNCLNCVKNEMLAQSSYLGSQLGKAAKMHFTNRRDAGVLCFFAYLHPSSISTAYLASSCLSNTNLHQNKEEINLKNRMGKRLSNASAAIQDLRDLSTIMT